MKKFDFKRLLIAMIAVLMVFAMCFAMTGCDKDDDKDDKDKDDKTSVSDKKDDDDIDDDDIDIDDDDIDIDDDDIDIDDDDDDKYDDVDDAEDVVVDYLESEFIDFDAEDSIDLMYPDYVDHACENSGITYDQFVETSSSTYKNTYDTLESKFDDWHFEFEVKGERPVANEEIEQAKDYYKENINVDVQEFKAYDYEAELFYENDGNYDSQITRGIVYVVKIGGEWYYQSEKVNN